MLKGKIISDGHDYSVKVGGVSVDITADVRSLIAREVAQKVAAKELELANERRAHADTVNRYHQIAAIVLAGGSGMPTG